MSEDGDLHNAGFHQQHARSSCTVCQDRQPRCALCAWLLFAHRAVMRWGHHEDMREQASAHRVPGRRHALSAMRRLICTHG